MLIEYVTGYAIFPLLEKMTKRQIAQKLRELKAFSQLTNAQQLEIQRVKAVELLTYCAAHVPYYKQIFQETGFQVDNVAKDIRYIQDLPVLTKEIVRERIGDLKSQGAFHTRKTGGSTGQSVFFYYDNDGLDWTAAVNLLALEMAGKKVHHTDMHISADSEILGIGANTVRDKFKDWLKLRSQNRARLMVSSFDDQSLEKMYREVLKRSPYMLQGHPSTVYAIADFVARTRMPTKSLFKVFEPTGEMMTQKMVEHIEHYLGCKVVNRYGNAECGVIAHGRRTDSWQKLAVFRRAFYVEEGVSQPILVTALTNTGLPLIRYNTGDIGTVKEEDDGCFIYDILGRIHDRVAIDGVDWPTHFIMDALDHKIRGVREFQIIIEPNENPLLKIVPERQEDSERIMSAIQVLWPRGIRIEFIQFDDLERVGWRQKFRHIIDKKRNAGG